MLKKKKAEGPGQLIIVEENSSVTNVNGIISVPHVLLWRRILAGKPVVSFHRDNRARVHPS